MLFSFFLFYFICCERRSKPLPLVNVKSQKKKKLQFDYSNQGTWKKIIQSQRFLKTKNSQGFFLQTNQKRS